MMKYSLTEDYVLRIEPEKEKSSRLRLIIKQRGQELVCRKEGLNRLLDFVQGGDAHLFKGRLQLSKENDAINIYMKDSLIGSIKANVLAEELNQLWTKIYNNTKGDSL
jgi:hypothetical protein